MNYREALLATLDAHTAPLQRTLRLYAADAVMALEEPRKGAIVALVAEKGGHLMATIDLETGAVPRIWVMDPATGEDLGEIVFGLRDGEQP